MRGQEAIALLSRALIEVGLEPVPAASNAQADLSVRSRDGLRVDIDVEFRSLVREGDVPAITTSRTAPKRHPGVAGLVVADRITADAKTRLRAQGWGWLDLRGHLHIEAPGVFVDARVTPAEQVASATKQPLAGTVGLELASLLLMDPTRTYGVRAAAAELGRAPSSVSQEMTRLRHAGLVDTQHRPVRPDLFWALAGQWRPESVDIATLPDRGSGPISAALQLGLEDPEHGQGWALGDTLAAIAYGAPVSVSGAYPPDLYVPDRATLLRATQLLGLAPSRPQRAATIRLAPVQLVTGRRVHLNQRAKTPWPLVHPLFVALDLAQDPGRGAEVLAAWDPPDRWQRVW